MTRKIYRYCPNCRTELIEAVHGGRPRRSCPSAGCGFVHWDNPIPVVAAIVEAPAASCSSEATDGP